MSATPAVAFQLTDEHELRTYGGTTHLRDGLHINLGEALREGRRPADAGEDWQPDRDDRGLLVTDDPALILILQERWDLRQLDGVPEGSKITSHQLAGTLAEQHERAHALPAIAEAQIVVNPLDLAYAQARGEAPVPTVAPEQPDTPVEPAPADAGKPAAAPAPATATATVTESQPTARQAGGPPPPSPRTQTPSDPGSN